MGDWPKQTQSCKVFSPGLLIFITLLLCNTAQHLAHGSHTLPSLAHTHRWESPTNPEPSEATVLATTSLLVLFIVRKMLANYMCIIVSVVFSIWINSCVLNSFSSAPISTHIYSSLASVRLRNRISGLRRNNRTRDTWTHELNVLSPHIGNNKM